MMLFPTAGLTDELVKTTLYKLEIVYEEKILANIFSSIIESLESTLSLVLKEMFSIRADIIYWETLNQSNSWEIQLFQWNSRLYNNLLLRPPNASIMVDSHNIHNTILNIIDLLQQKFTLLLMVLAKLHEITGSYLKEIVLLLLKSESTMMIGTSSASPGVEDFLAAAGIAGGAGEGEGHVPESILSIVYQKLQAAIQSLVMITHEHLNPLDKCIQQEMMKEKEKENLPAENITASTSYTTWERPDPMIAGENNAAEQQTNEIEFDECEYLYQYCFKIQTIIEDYQYEHENQNFPLQLVSNDLHRPTNNERFWIRNVLLLVGGVYTGTVLYQKYQDGSLQAITTQIMEKITSKLTEHVVEPIAKLGNELFHTIRSRETIVSRDDLELSREALERMLSDFSKSREGYALILPNMKEELLKKTTCII